MSLKEIISGKKYLSHSRGAKLESFEDDDNIEHNSELPSHG